MIYILNSTILWYYLMNINFVGNIYDSAILHLSDYVRQNIVFREIRLQYEQ